MKQKCSESLNIRISKETLDGIRDVANKKGTSYSKLIREILKEYIEKNKGE